MRRMLAVLGITALLLLAACGGGGGGGGSASCSPSGTTIKVTAQNLAYDKACYAAPAGKPFTVDLDNKDSAPHNFAIYTDSSASNSLFVSPTITALAKSFSVKPLQPGTYYFQCDIHPSMNGTFVVK
jgi:plastocyanin